MDFGHQNNYFGICAPEKELEHKNNDWGISAEFYLACFDCFLLVTALIAAVELCIFYHL